MRRPGPGRLLPAKSPGLIPCQSAIALQTEEESMNPIFFTAEHLTAGYGKQTVLEDVSFSLEQGTITGLLGANGSGKSTLLKALCRLLPVQGSCLLKGHPLERLSRRSLARQISYIPQRSGVTLSLPLLEVVLMGFNPGLGLLQRPSPGQREKACQALDTVGLGGMEETDYLTLSEGQKQLCILARTMVEQTCLLLLDEPDSALDFYNRYHMLRILQGLVQSKERAALVCLHDPCLALDLCQQLLLLKGGRCMALLHPTTDPLSHMQEAFSRIYGPVSLIRCRDRLERERLVLLPQTGDIYPPPAQT